MLILLSTPVGIHHQFMEPGISRTWKMLHTVTTYGVAIPSFITAFAIFASFELYAIKRGTRGFIATVRVAAVERSHVQRCGARDDPLHPGRFRRARQRLVQHGYGRAQHDLDRRTFPRHRWRSGRANVSRRGVLADPAPHGPGALEAGVGAVPDAPVVLRHADHVAVDALRRPARRAAAHGQRGLYGSGNGAERGSRTCCWPPLAGSSSS